MGRCCEPLHTYSRSAAIRTRWLDRSASQSASSPVLFLGHFKWPFLNFCITFIWFQSNQPNYTWKFSWTDEAGNCLFLLTSVSPLGLDPPVMCLSLEVPVTSLPGPGDGYVWESCHLLGRLSGTGKWDDLFPRKPRAGAGLACEGKGVWNIEKEDVLHFI